MRNIVAIPQTATLKNLHRLFWLRTVMASLITLAAWAATHFYEIPLPFGDVGGAVALMAVLNAFTWWRLRHPASVTDAELLTQLLLDMAVLTGLFYATGGYTNPFVWMYLLPLTVAAVALPWKHTWLVAGLAVACYSGLMFWYDPLPVMQMDMSGMSAEEMRAMHHGSGFSIHLLGMWAGFVVSAGVIAFFVERIGRNLREYDRLIAETREKALESERMLALGALATGAAHELGTPLSTMAVVSGELIREYAAQPELADQLRLLRSQVDRCKQILSSIAASAGEVRAEDGQSQPLDTFLEDTFARWRDMRPAVPLEYRSHGNTPIPHIVVDRALGQALTSLVNNAADASPERVEIFGDWDAAELRLTIRDHGLGIAPETQQRIGQAFFTTKQSQGGLGLGVFLARTIIERLGGTVSLENHAEGGALTRIRLPLAALRTKPAA